MNYFPILTEQQHEKLKVVLKTMKTRDYIACEGFQITGDRKNVRISADEALKCTRRPMDYLELAELIYTSAKQEEDSMELYKAEKEKILSTIYQRFIELVLDVSKIIEKMRKETFPQLKSAFREFRPFLRLIRQVDNEDFPEKLDEILSRLSNPQNCTLGGLEGLLNQKLALCVAQTEIEIKKCFDEMKDFLKIKKARVSGFNKKEMKAIFKILPSVTTQGISLIQQKPKEVFGIFHQDGLVEFLEFVENKRENRFQFRVQAAHAQNSIEFNPNGDMFTLTSYYEKTTNVFSYPQFSLINQWKNPKCKYVQRAKWASNKNIISSFAWPGEIHIYEVGSPLPLFMISPLEFKEDKISDFDFCGGSYTTQDSLGKSKVFSDSFVQARLLENQKIQDKAERCSSVICGGYKKVFRIKLQKNYEKIEWKHEAHSSTVTTIRVSIDDAYVLSGGNDMLVALANSHNGEVLSTFSQFSSWLKGLIWTMSNHYFLGWTENEVKMVFIYPKNHEMVPSDEISYKESGENKKIESVGVYWGLSAGSYLLLAVKEKIIKVFLR